MTHLEDRQMIRNEPNWKPLKIPETSLTVKTELGLKVKMLIDNWVHVCLFISWWKHKHLQTEDGRLPMKERKPRQVSDFCKTQQQAGPSYHSHWKKQSSTNKYTLFRKTPGVLSFSIYDQDINQNKEFNSRGCLWE